MRSAASRPLLTRPTCCPIWKTALASDAAAVTASSDRAVAAHQTVELVVERHLPGRRDHAQLQALALDAQPRGPLVEGAARQQVFEEDPGDGQAGVVADGEADLDVIADLGGELVAG